MPLVSLAPLLEKARAHHYAVGSFNVFDLNMAGAIIEAAEEAHSPIVMAVAASHSKYMDFDTFGPALVRRAERSSIPVVVHLDHSEELGLVTRAIMAGFTSVMFDGFGFTADEKLRQTRSVTDMAHSVGITVEAEFGHITKLNEDADDRTNWLIDADHVKHFVEETQLDVVASAVGSVHGLTDGATELDLDLLKRTIDQTPCFVSLHGGSGMKATDIQSAIALGVVKFSYFTGLSRAAMESARTVLLDQPDIRLTEFTQSIARAVGEQAVAMMLVYGSVDKA
jgi:fructose-bisphosphate aldolase class II